MVSLPASFKPDAELAVVIPGDNVELNGLLYVPSQAKGLVLFVHGSGSSRFSTRNQFVAHVLNKANLGTLLFDLLTPEEDELDNRTGELRFDIPFLSSRCESAIRWCQERFPSLNIGLFGASTGGGAALISSARLPAIKAVVSRGGRPDLANIYLPQVTAPTLLIVGGEDTPVIAMNQEAQANMRCFSELKIISGATHLFEEPGALDDVAELAKKWFLKYLT